MRVKFLIYTIIAFCITVVAQNVECGIKICEDKSFDLSITDIQAESISPDEYSFSAAESTLRVPRPTNFTNIQRAQTISKRVLTRGNDSFCILKDGKLLNKRHTTQYLYNLNRFPSGLTEASHHLISLGKLVI